MSPSRKAIEVYVEAGSKRCFAGAVRWPGWCRSGRNEDAAIEALLDYAPRYARVLRPAKVPFTVPANANALKVVERLKGNATTDFGAPGIPPAADERAHNARELARQEAVLDACWAAFDAAVAGAASRKLRTGPRGGGRNLPKIIEHVMGAQAGYLVRLGAKHGSVKGEALEDEFARLRREVVEAIEAAPRRGPPPPGPKGGKRSTARYFIRRSAWHILDHAWEIEDRSLPEA